MLQLIASLFFFMINDLDISHLNVDFGNALHVGSTGGGILLTLILVLATTSLAIWKQHIMAFTVISMLDIFASVVIGWLSYFALIIIIFVIALGIADKVTGILSPFKRGKS